MEQQKKKSKQVKFGTVWNKKWPDGRPNVCISLGQTSGKPEYQYDVTVMITDKKGNVIAKQTNGFLNVVDPRKLPEELLAAGKIGEDTADKMRGRLTTMPVDLTREIFLTVKE